MDQLKINSLKLSIYMSEEIRRMAVKEIHIPQSFDSVGVPNVDGLYDPMLGPTDKTDVCVQCGLCSTNCLGHFGYIALPVPVYSPVLFDSLMMILKSVCFECCTLSTSNKRLSLVKLMSKCLRKCCVEAFYSLKDYFLDTIETSKTSDHEFEHMIKKITKKFKNEDSQNSMKILRECQLDLYDDFFRNFIIRKDTCPNCGAIMPKPKAQSPGIVIYKSMVEEKIVTKKLMSLEARDIIRRVWMQHSDLLPGLLKFVSDGNCSIDAFFTEDILVTPNKFRPMMHVKGSVYEHPKTQQYSSIILLSAEIRETVNNFKETKNEVTSTVIKLWENLQRKVNVLYSGDGKNSACSSDFKKFLEKKTGIIRQNLMGKRVNFAARSVISPDPLLGAEEVGIPIIVASQLTFPETVTPHNVSFLQNAVMNGPEIYPGASFLVEGDTTYYLNPNNDRQRQSIADRLLINSSEKTVLRHLRTGDYVYMNRQPTLHRPSIQAHKVRVLGEEKTLRIHYSTCKAYNADFDGDELNCHLPQSQLCRAEALLIAAVTYQHIVPKDGSPSFGMIQDHLIAGTLMCLRGRFFDGQQFRQLLYSGLYSLGRPIQIPPPAMIKPKLLWAGKQVISAVLDNMIPSHFPPLNLTGPTKISDKIIYGTDSYGDPYMREDFVIIRHNELLCGFLDKTNIGASAYGLIHMCFELYGGKIATDILSCFSRLFIFFLKIRGFSIGIEDTLVSHKAHELYKSFNKSLYMKDTANLASALGVNMNDTEEIYKQYRKVHCSKKDMKELDRKMRSLVDSQEYINKSYPNEFIRKFPHNNMILMVDCGAKGTKVNLSHISCVVGQIELEGSRPSMMTSGRCLPMFAPYSASCRSRGFVTDRFLTGMKPSSFFFHCMAGREGLVDTAIKTSQSGYLQRCLVKTLENLVVGYDMTVRDNDGSIIQFYYGEDGIDPTKGSCLRINKFPFLVQNSKSLLNQDMVDKLSSEDTLKVAKLKKKIKKRSSNTNAFRVFEEIMLDKNPGLDSDSVKTAWGELDLETRLKFIPFNPDPILFQYRPDIVFGAVSDSLTEKVDEYIALHHKELLEYDISKAEFRDLINYKYMSSLIAPGENVGMLAAQSVGEPSTQMTLNTFHFAGVGDLNVTLGMPRLKEILMSMSGKTKTPFVKVPIKEIYGVETFISRLLNRFEKIYFKQVLNETNVRQNYVSSRDCNSVKFDIEFHLNGSLDGDLVCRFIETKFIKKLNTAIGRTKSAGFQINVKANEADKSFKEHSESEEVEEDEVSSKSSSDGEISTEEEEESVENEDSDVTDYSDCEKVPSKSSRKFKSDYDRRIYDVKKISFVNNYDYDKVDRRWCKVELEFPFSVFICDINACLDELINKLVVYSYEGIEKAFVMENKDKSISVKRFFCTEGVNIESLLDFENILDFSRLETNDTLTVQRMFGIEAVARNIIKEIRTVFKIYAINVDYRHLSLLTDYMTSEGVYKGCNRRSIMNNPSLIQRMTFESAATVLQRSLISGAVDDFKSTSSRIAFGLPTGGTNFFDLVSHVDYF